MDARVFCRWCSGALVAILLATTTTGCIFDINLNGEPDVWVGDSFTETVSASGTDRLVVRGISGTVDVVGQHGDNRFLIEGERRVGSNTRRDAERHLDELEVELFRDGRTLVVETLQPRHSYGRRYEVDYVLTVPDDVEVIIENTNGEIVVEALVNYLSVKVTNGPVFLYDLVADVEVTTTNGDIEAELAVLRDGFVDLKTTNGDIDLFIPRTTSAELSARVTNGRVTVANLTLADVVQSVRSLEARMGSGRGEITLRTTNGSIRIAGTL